MRNPRSPSEQIRKSFDLERQLNLYALAAAAAGVGMLALAQPAKSEITYTKAHRRIGPNTTLHLDVNHDGVADFDLKDIFSTTSQAGAFGRLTAIPAQRKNHIWGHTVFGRGFASVLYAGVRVGPNGQFLPGSGLMAATTFNGGLRLRPPAVGICTAPWADVTNRYLGLRFVISGKVHFGWARLNVSCNGNTQVTATLTGYAYETVPNRPIVTARTKGLEDNESASQQKDAPAGEASLRRASLGRLAQGKSGSTVWRRKE
jgi:hypothetical protein